MRIAVDIRALMEGKTTGVEVYLSNLLHNIFRIDRKNKYILWANSFADVSKNLPQFDFPNVSMRITRYPNKFFNLAQKLGSPKIDNLLGPLDLFFSPHWRVLALSGHVPLVVTFHDLVSEFAPQFFTWRRRLWHTFMDYPAAARLASKIIAVSATTMRDLTELYGVPEQKIRVIYPGTGESSQSPLKPGTDDTGLYFLYFGTLEPRKNIETALVAYQNYYEQSHIKRRLVIAGSSGWKTMLRIPPRLRHQVMVRPNVSEDDKNMLFSGAYALIFPSFYEGFGFPVLEAAAKGLPVIAGYSSSVAEIFSDFVLYANPFRPQSFAGAMLELESNENLRKDYADRGHKAAENFKWQTAAELTLKLFLEFAPGASAL